MGRYKQEFSLVKRGGYYSFWYYDNGKRRLKATGVPYHPANHLKAIDAARKFLSDREREAVSFRNLTQTIFRWGECEWTRLQVEKKRKFSKGNAQNRRGHLDNHILPELGDRDPREITSSELESFLLELPLNNQTRNHVLYTLNMVYDILLSRGQASDNPARKVVPFGPDGQQTGSFFDDECDKLFPKDYEKLLELYENGIYARLFYLLYCSGIRLGEALVLTPHDWIESGGFSITKALKRDGSIGPVKTGYERVACVDDFFIELFRLWESPERFLFSYYPTRPMYEKTVGEAFKRARKRAGVVGGRSIRSIRTTYNTRLRNQGIAGEIIRLQLGHKSIKMTDLYDAPTDSERVLALRRDILQLQRGKSPDNSGRTT